MTANATEKKANIFLTEPKDDKLYPLNHSNLGLKDKVAKSWMIRNCDIYSAEYKNCSSLKGRFYRYYVDGETTLDCGHWKENFNDCELWTNQQDLEAAARIVSREDKRIHDRLKSHYSNNVWEKRTGPPDDWNKPLPKHLAESSENSLLKNYKENGGFSQDDLLKIGSAKMATSLPSCAIL